MEKQHLKRLAYGFSALVMALSAVTFVPGDSAYATSACAADEASFEVLVGTVDTICLNASFAVEDTIDVDQDLVIDLNGKTLTKGTDALFTVADGKTLTITGEGTIAGVTSMEELATLGAEASINVQGGSYEFDVAPAANYTAYEVEEATTWEVARTVKFKNLVASVPRKRRLGAGDSRPMGTYTTGVTVNGEEWLPTVVVTDADDNEVAETDFRATVAEGRVTVYGYTAGTYKATVTDATGASVTATFTVYEFAEDTLNGDVYYVALGDTLALADTYTASFAAGTPVTYAVSNDDDAIATVDDDITVTAVAVGSTDVTLTLSDSEETKMKFTVNVFDADDETLTLASGSEKPFDVTYANWSETFTNTDEEVAAAAFNGNTFTITAGNKVGTTDITLTDASDDTITKTFTVNSYKLATSVTMVEDSTLRYDDASIVELPEGWTVTAAPKYASTTVAELAGNFLIANTAGQKIFNYTIKDSDANTIVNAGRVTLYVYDADANMTSIEDQYLTVSAGVLSNVSDLYVTTNGGTVTYTTSDADATVDAEDDQITFVTTGEKTITFTETLGNKVINTVDAKVYVTGLVSETASKLVGETATLTVNPFMGTFKSETIPAGLTVTKDGASYAFSAEEAGEYTYTIKVSEIDEVNGDATTTLDYDYNYTINFYAPMTVSTEGKIDLKEGSEYTAITVTATADDGDVTVTDENETATGLLITDNDDGTWTVKAGTAEEGTYTLTATHTAEDGTVLETTPIEINVDDSTVVLNPTLTLLDEDDLELTIGDEEGASFGFTYSDIEDPNFTIVITDSEEGDATEDFAYGFAEGEEAGEVLANIVAGEGADAGTYTLTLTETTSEKSVQKTIVVSEAEAPEMPTLEDTVLFQAMVAGTSIEVEAEAGANVKVFDLSEYIGEEDEDEQGIAVDENHYAFADEGDITVEETAEGVYTISALKAGAFYVNIEKQDEEGNIVVTNVTLLVTSATTEAADTVTDLLSDEVEAVNASENALFNYYKVITAEYDTEEEYNEAVAAAQVALKEASQATEEAGLAIQNAFGDDAEAIMAAVVEGKTLSTKVEVEKLDEVDEGVETALLDALGADYVGNVSFYDIDVDLYADGVKIGTLKELTSEQTIVIEGMEAAEAGYTRVYKVVRYHTYIDENGDEQVTVDEIEDVEFDADAGTLTFGSDKFSTYAVSYIDELSASVDTGRNTAEASASSSAVMAIASAIAAITLAGAAIFAKRK